MPHPRRCGLAVDRFAAKSGHVAGRTTAQIRPHRPVGPHMHALLGCQVNSCPAANPRIQCRHPLTKLRRSPHRTRRQGSRRAIRSRFVLFRQAPRLLLRHRKHVQGVALTMQGVLLISSSNRSSPGPCRALAQFSASLLEKYVRARGLAPRVAGEYVARQYIARRRSQVQHSAPVHKAGRGEHDSRPAYALHRHDCGKDFRYVQ